MPSCLGCFVYREIGWRDLTGIITESVVGTASILIIMSAAQPFSWVLTYELAPQKVLALVENANLAQWELYLLINIAMLILGCFMEGLAVMIMAVPVLLPILEHAGIDLVHFGIVFVLNIMIGDHHAASRDDHVRGLRPEPYLYRRVFAGGVAVCRRH